MAQYQVNEYRAYPELIKTLGIPTVYAHESLIKRIEALKPDEKIPEALVVDKDDFLTEEALPALVRGTLIFPAFEFITALGMKGHLDFRKSYGLRINMLKLAGYMEEDFRKLAKKHNYFLPGADEFISYFDMPRIIVSGGVLEEALECAAVLGIDAVIANDAGFQSNGSINGHHYAYVNGNKGEIVRELRKYFSFIYGGGDSSTDVGIMENSDVFVAGPRSKEKLIMAARMHEHAILVPSQEPLSYAIAELEKYRLKI